MQTTQRNTTEVIYSFIEQFTRTHEIPPTVREIAEACYLAPSSVLRHLEKLEAQKRIVREPRRARGIRLLHPERP